MYWILISPRPQPSLYAGQQRIFFPFFPPKLIYSPEMHRSDKSRQCTKCLRLRWLGCVCHHLGSSAPVRGDIYIKLGAQGQRGRHFAAHTSASTLLRAYEVRRALCLRYPLLRRFLKTYAWYVDAENVTKHKVSSYPLFLHPAPINNLSINTRPGSPVLALLNKNAGISY